MNRCPRCNKIRDHYKNDSLCKECRKLQSKEWREANYDRWLENTRKRRLKNRDKSNKAKQLWRRKVKLEVLQHYGGKCVCCSEHRFEFLALDHIEGKGNIHRKSIGLPAGINFLAWIKRNDFPSGFQVLCHNCNQALGTYGYCPHVPND